MAEQAVGTCSLCGQRTTKGAMPRHLTACAPQHDPARGARVEWLHLRVEGGGPYWLDVEARGDSRLEQLDQFVRRVWLECCGHMSAFFVAGTRAERYDEYPIDAVLAGIFRHGDRAVRYEYDFGSTTELLLRGVDARIGRGDKKTRIRLLARNDAPETLCDTCGPPATQVCPFWEADNPFVCDAHAGNHPCDDPDTHLPVVNSPRMGVCGYAG